MKHAFPRCSVNKMYILTKSQLPIMKMVWRIFGWLWCESGKAVLHQQVQGDTLGGYYTISSIRNDCTNHGWKGLFFNISTIPTNLIAPTEIFEFTFSQSEFHIHNINPSFSISRSMRVSSILEVCWSIDMQVRNYNWLCGVIFPTSPNIIQNLSKNKSSM